MTITLRMDGKDWIEQAACFCAELARQGVTFTARQSGAELLITLTGGF